MKPYTETSIPWEHAAMPTPAMAETLIMSDAEAQEWSNALLYTLPLQDLPPHVTRDVEDDAGSWLQLALSVVHQAVNDAAQGDPDALAWLLTEGTCWLEELHISPLIVDAWAADL
jgi:hypothetical protein